MTIKRFSFATGQTETVEEDAPSFPVPTSVPDSIQRLQARIILGRSTLANGVLTIHASRQAGSLLVAVEAITAQIGGETADAWANLIVLRRNSPMLAGLAQALGLTSDHLDTLFIAGAQVAL